MKRFKAYINGIQRYDETLNNKDIVNKLKQKWIKDIIEKTDDFNIQIFSTNFAHEFTPNSGWNVTGIGDKAIIRLKDSVGKIQEYKLDEIYNKRLKKENKILLNEFENILEQAKLMFLTGYKDYECAFDFILTQLKYKSREYKSEHLPYKEGDN